MKTAIFSDIHGNLHALEAVLRHAHNRGATQIILNLGDSIGYGPDPEGVIHRINRPNFVNILGDYDNKVISKQNRKNGWESVRTPEKRQMFSWTYQALSKPSRKFLRSLPEQRNVELAGLKISMTHGSPSKHNEYLGPETPEKRFETLAQEANSDVVLCGHTHQAFIHRVKGSLFVNPGSVGRPDDGDPRASYAILEITEGAAAAQTFRVPYHISGAVQALRRTGLPDIFAEVLRQGLNYNDILKKFGEDPLPGWLEPSGIITLLTDFGLKDHFIGVMKGVILDISPITRLVDISHQIRPQNVVQAARMLQEAAPYFPPGTVHVAVVDPGVGTARRALAARIGSYFFVAPDNGLLSPLLERAKAEDQEVTLISLDDLKYWLPNPSSSFHGRDIFSPVGAHLANGLPLEKLGKQIDDPVIITLPQPERTAWGLLGEVAIVDVFGNLNTNIPAKLVQETPAEIKIKIGDTIIEGLTHTFGTAEPGTLIATIDSTGSLAVSVVNGNAAGRLHADIGTPVEVFIENKK